MKESREIDPALGDDCSPEDTVYLQQVAETFLALRGTGLFLSPLDADLIVNWQEARLPLQGVLRGMLRGAEKLQAKKQPLRTLGRLKRYVTRETGTTSQPARRGGRRRSGGGIASEPVDPGQLPQYDAVMALLSEHQGRLERLIETASLPGQDGVRQVLERTRMLLGELEAPAHWGPGGPVPALMAVGRRFYEELKAVLPLEERERLLFEAQAALEGFETGMSEEARAETLEELLVTFLRDRYSLFEPGRILALWDS